jgi:signal transduction histidine kinase
MENLVLQTFFNILEQDMILKEEQVTSTQKRLERYQMFVQHEIKNIAQFINLLSTQVERIEEDKDKIRLADRLKKTLPAMAQRAQKTIQTMKDPSLSQEKEATFDVSEVLNEVVHMYDLPCKVLGSAEVTMRQELVLEIFKNVLGNFRDHNVGNDLTVYVADNAQPNMVEIQVQNRNIPGVTLLPERMFEPFWTTSESGLGLGLFLARELLKQVSGEIKFQQGSQHFGFILSLPKMQA